MSKFESLEICEGAWATVRAERDNLYQENRTLRALIAKLEAELEEVKDAIEAEALKAYELKGELEKATEWRSRYQWRFRKLDRACVDWKKENDQLRARVAELEGEGLCPECGETYEIKVLGRQHCGWGSKDPQPPAAALPECPECGEVPTLDSYRTEAGTASRAWHHICEPLDVEWWGGSKNDWIARVERLKGSATDEV